VSAVLNLAVFIKIGGRSHRLWKAIDALAILLTSADFMLKVIRTVCYILFDFWPKLWVVGGKLSFDKIVNVSFRELHFKLDKNSKKSLEILILSISKRLKLPS
jgi:hypothetical protein